MYVEMFVTRSLCEFLWKARARQGWLGPQGVLWGDVDPANLGPRDTDQ